LNGEIGRLVVLNAHYSDYTCNDEQETWVLKIVCVEWQSVEVWTRTMQYACTCIKCVVATTWARIRAPPSLPRD